MDAGNSPRVDLTGISGWFDWGGGEEDSEVGTAPSLIDSLSGCGSGWA